VRNRSRKHVDSEPQASLPTDSRDSFAILVREGLIQQAPGARLQKMVSFRNLAVHRYRALDLVIVEEVIRHDLEDVLEYAEIVRRELERV
jgi:uncharacterized protein YutE (UPF0331/DUF86 family)